MSLNSGVCFKREAAITHTGTQVRNILFSSLNTCCQGALVKHFVLLTASAELLRSHQWINENIQCGWNPTFFVQKLSKNMFFSCSSSSPTKHLCPDPMFKKSLSHHHRQMCYSCNDHKRNKRPFHQTNPNEKLYN